MRNVGGWIPDAPDDRDWNATRKLGLPPAPESGTCACHVHAPLDQEHLGACTWHALAQLLWSSHVRQGVPDPELVSILAGYYLTRAWSGEEKFDSGCSIRSAVRVLNKFGFCPESAWPYDVTKFAEMPPTSAFMAAHDMRGDRSPAAEYYRIYEEGSQRLDAVRRCVAAGIPVAFGTQVSREFVADGGGKVWLPPDPSDVAGGHAIVVVAYSGSLFSVLSSWGAGWGTDGRCLMDEAYITWGETRDFWVVRHAPPYLGA